LGSVVDYDGLNKVVQAYSNGANVNEDDIRAAF
jgi:Ca2+-binding EF-hand superfamily protein